MVGFVAIVPAVTASEQCNAGSIAGIRVVLVTPPKAKPARAAVAREHLQGCLQESDLPLQLSSFPFQQLLPLQLQHQAAACCDT